MHSREDSDRLSWALSALVVLIMGVAVGVSSRQPSHDPDPGSATAAGQSQHPESRAQSQPGTAGSRNPPSLTNAAK